MIVVTIELMPGGAEHLRKLRRRGPRGGEFAGRRSCRHRQCEIHQLAEAGGTNKHTNNSTRIQK
jgi:hypothetical protein